VALLYAEITARSPGRDLVVEGADLLPELLRDLGVQPHRAIWLVPTPEFQLRHYARRSWVADYLRDCPDPAGAFDRWMRRDMLFARHVRRTASAFLTVDGSRPIDHTCRLIEEHFDIG
jgi:hypothetical protein